MALSDFDQSYLDYESAASPYAGLQDYLLNRPVFERGPAPDTQLQKIRTSAPSYQESTERLNRQYKDLLEQQAATEQAQTQARETAITDLRDTLRQETADLGSSLVAERSEVVKALEDQLDNVKSSLAEETQTLRDQGIEERSEAQQQRQQIVDTLEQNLSQAKDELKQSQDALRQEQTAALGSLEERQGSIIGDLQGRIGDLNSNLDNISSTLRNEQSQLSDELREAQRGSVDAIQQNIDGLQSQLDSVSQSVADENTSQTNLLRDERDQLVSALETQIADLSGQVGNIPVDEIQNRISEISANAQSFQDTASTERKQLFDQLEAIKGSTVTEEDFQQLKGTFEQTGGMLQDAITAATGQRERLQSQIQSLQEAQLDPANIEAQRQAAITGAIDPLQQQIAQIQESIPQQVDTEALRKQITEEVLAGLPQQPTGNVQAPTVRVGPGVGGMDPYGQGGISTLPTTEGAAEMGATPFFDPGIGSEMGQGVTDPTGATFVPTQTNVQRRAVTGQPELPQANQSLLDKFNTSQAASDFGLSATFDPATGQYVTDIGGFGFTGDQRYKRQTPEEFAAQFAPKTKKPPAQQQAGIGLPINIGIGKQPLGRIKLR
tara:strand:- start:297 stop:2123 length:1827 start_codon:yes stop_codon:yes gene_type:complete